MQTWLDHGFTAMRDACEGDSGYGQFALRDSIEKGLIHGPRIVSAGGCVSLTGGHGDGDVLAPDFGFPNRPNIADTPEDVERVVRRDIKYGADWIKLMATGGVMDPISDYRVQELSQDQMAKAVEVAHRAGKKVMAHAEGSDGIKAAVRAGVDSVEHGTVLDEEGAQLIQEKGTWLVPTLYCFQHDMETGLSQGRDPASFAKGVAIIKEQGPAFKRALAHHLKIAYGVDDDPDSLSKEFGALVRGGMTPIEALRAATVNGAELQGRSKDIGTLEPGKFAVWSSRRRSVERHHRDGKSSVRDEGRRGLEETISGCLSLCRSVKSVLIALCRQTAIVFSGYNLNTSRQNLS